MIILEQYENYNKGSYRNKCLVSSNQRSQYLIIPLKKGKNRSQPIRDVRISYDEDWPRIMENRLQTEYGNYPYYAYYIEDIMTIIHQHPVFLFDLNVTMMTYFLHILGGKEIKYTQEYKPEYPDNILDIRAQITPQLFKVYPQLLKPVQIEYFTFNPAHSFIEVLFLYGPEVRRLVHEYGKSISWKR